MYVFIILWCSKYLWIFTSFRYSHFALGNSLPILFLNLRMSNFGLEPQTSSYRKNISNLRGLQSDTVSVWFMGDDFCGLHACNTRTPLTRRLSLHKWSRLRLSYLSSLCGVITALSGNSGHSKQILLPCSLSEVILVKFLPPKVTEPSHQGPAWGLQWRDNITLQRWRCYIMKYF